MKTLLCTHRSYKNRMDDIHLSACWSSLGHLARLQPSKQCWAQKNAELLELLVHHTLRIAKAGEIGARELANVVYGVARSGMWQSLGVFRAALARAAEQKVE